MLNKYATMLYTIIALSALTSIAAAGEDLRLQARAPAFLQPVELRFVLASDDPMRPQACARSPKCPPVVSSAGIPGGHAVESIGSYLPNVRVTFFVQEISNEVISKGGVTAEPGSAFVYWSTTGSKANLEDGIYGYPLPAPGEAYDNFGAIGAPNGLKVYDALVFNACGSFSSFPVQHDATVEEWGEVIGAFSGTDNSTIDSTGYYNLNYTIRAESSNGAISDFHFRGKVSAICSGLSSL